MDDATNPPVDADSAAPKSNLTCATFQSYWVAGHQGPFVVKHVENCDHCLKILFGDGETWKLSIEEEAEQELANERRAKRRRFIVAAAAGIMALMVGGWSFNRIRAGRTQPPLVPVPPAIASQDARFDAIFATGGVAAIQQRLASATPGESYFIFSWICTRGHVALYGDVVNGLGDPRQQVQRHALTILRTIAPNSLKAYLPQIQAFNALQSNPSLKGETDTLIKIITAS